MRFYLRSIFCGIFVLSIVVISILCLHQSGYLLRHKLIGGTIKDNYLECAVHIGIVHVGYKSNINLYTMLKSLYFYRNISLHLHIIVDDISLKILKILFETWNVPQVTTSFYNVNKLQFDEQFLAKYPKLMFPQLISTSLTSKIILLDTDVIITDNINEVWSLFEEFKETQSLGLFEHENTFLDKSDQTSTPSSFDKSFDGAVILYHLKRLDAVAWKELWTQIVNKDGSEEPALTELKIINIIATQNLDLVYSISTNWKMSINNTNNYCTCINNNLVKAVSQNSSRESSALAVNYDTLKKQNFTFTEYDGNLLKQPCIGATKNKNVEEKITTELSSDSCQDFANSYNNRWRILLFLKSVNFSVTENDVTLASQLTYDRFTILEDLGRWWDGPMSLTFFMSESEIQKCLHFIDNSLILKNRSNIAYHVVFKEDYHHPINLCRNIAMRNAITPYVFLVDIDFLPMQGLYTNLKKYIGDVQDMDKKALVVAAFETKPGKKFPTNRQEVLQMMKKKTIFPFKVRFIPYGHKATNYNKWKTADAPYKIEWQFRFEPYVVVKQNAAGYDERFVGYGWDKISHCTKLYAQGYEFMVLPDAFIVHKNHEQAPGRIHAKSARYRNCLHGLMLKVVKELEEEHNITIKI